MFNAMTTSELVTVLRSVPTGSGASPADDSIALTASSSVIGARLVITEGMVSYNRKGEKKKPEDRE